jgi:hypothetical protein
MADKSEMFKALPNASWMALLLTGNVEVAEAAVLDGIAALKLNRILGDRVLLAAARSAIQRRTAVPEHSEALSLVPARLRRLFLLAPNDPDCFVLRVLIGRSYEFCCEVLHLSIREVEDALYAVLQELPFIETSDITRCHSVHLACDAALDPCISTSGASAWPPAR